MQYSKKNGTPKEPLHKQNEPLGTRKGPEWCVQSEASTTNTPGCSFLKVPVTFWNNQVRAL